MPSFKIGGRAFFARDLPDNPSGKTLFDDLHKGYGKDDPLLNERPMTALDRRQCRNAASQDKYARRLIQLTRNNVLGSKGVQLDIERTTGAPSRIETLARWDEWLSNPEISTEYNNLEFQIEVLESVIKEGEMFLRWVRSDDMSAPTHLRYKLQIVRSSRFLDNDAFANDLLSGEYVDNTVIRNQLTGKPIAYVFKGQDGSPVRYSASEIEHIYWKPSSYLGLRGISWLRPLLDTAGLLRTYEKSYPSYAIRQAKMPGTATLPVSQYNEQFGIGASGRPVDNVRMRPRVKADEDAIDYSMEGTGWVPFTSDMNPRAFVDVRHALLAGLSVGYGINYNTVASDLAGINFTTGRMAKLEDETFYTELHEWWSGCLLRIFKSWAEKHAQLLESTWEYKFTRRAYKYLDPAKEAGADETEIANRTTSPQQIMRENGKDPQRIFDDLLEVERIFGGRDEGQETQGAGNSAESNSVYKSLIDVAAHKNGHDKNGRSELLNGVTNG